MLNAKNRPYVVLAVLAALALISVICFMTLNVRGNWGFVLGFRGKKLLGLLLTAWTVGVSTVLFQTVTNNRILTPSIMGFDALFVLMQTFVVFFLGTEAIVTINPNVKFLYECGLMLVFSAVLFRWLFVGEERSLHLLVLIGIVFGTLFRSFSQLMQRMLDPNAFQVLQDSFFASFQTLDPTILTLATVMIAAASLVLWRIGHTFDVLSLGRGAAINLGVNYKGIVIVILLMVAVMVAVSTALVGPITFFGLLVVSLAHGLIGNSRHRFILPAAVLLGVICLVGGQMILERVFEFDTALSIIVEFLGGLVFIFLVIRGTAR